MIKKQKFELTFAKVRSPGEKKLEFKKFVELLYHLGAEKFLNVDVPLSTDKKGK